MIGVAAGVGARTGAASYFSAKTAPT
jgi:hypothetical protein